MARMKQTPRNPNVDKQQLQWVVMFSLKEEPL